MTKKKRIIELSPGSCADDRLPMPLRTRSALLRPTSVAKILCTAARELGAERDTPASDDPSATPWQRLFHAEPAYLYAELISFDVAGAGFAFDEALDNAPEDAIQMVSKLAEALQSWITRISRLAPKPFSKQLQQLNAEAHLSELLIRLAGKHPSQIMQVLAECPKVEQRGKTAGALFKARALREELRHIHTIFRYALATLQPQAETAFASRIMSRDIDPTLGLLIAELRAGALVDAQINDIALRHTRHYYQDIVGQSPKPASAERVLLDLESGPQPLLIPKGAKLEARLPDDSVQLFATETAVHVTPAKITDIAVLSYATDQNISYNRALSGISGVRAARIAPDGGSAGRLFSPGTEQPFNMGLDISSPMLLLAEGVRKVELSLNMKRRSNLAAVSRPLADHEEEKILGTPDPELRLSLAADPDLIAMFQPRVRDPVARQTSDTPVEERSESPSLSLLRPGKTETAIDYLTKAVNAYAAERKVTPSQSLIYEYLTIQLSEHPPKDSAVLDALRLLLGRIVVLSLIEQIPFPAGIYWDRLYTLIDRYRKALTGQQRPDPKSSISDEKTSMIFAAFSDKADGTIDYPPEEVFQSLLGDAFDVTITTADGPLAPSVMQLLPNQCPSSKGGLTIRMRIDEASPAITGATSEGTPTLSIRYAHNARVCPVSFFEHYILEDIDISVAATGMQKLVAFSDVGPVTTDQTFSPFGASPEDGATFQVGCPEMARKPVTEIGMVLDWAKIPDPVGGFESHYAGYGDSEELPDPVLSIDYLSGDGWKSVTEAPVPLFQKHGVTGALQKTWRYTGRIAGRTIPALGAVNADEYQSRQTIRAGMVRVSLSGTAGGFRAGEYPIALAKAMRPRLIPLAKRKVPSVPFVPSISRLALSYAASATLELNAPNAARPGERIVQVGAFGSVEVFPERNLSEVTLLPQRLGYGQLMLQIGGPNVTGPMVLAFHMRESGHLRFVPPANPIRWFYLSANGWQELQATAISSDTTAGLMRSGLVMIDLPDDAASHSTSMPNGGVWIAAVATEPHLETFPELSQVKVNGVWTKRQNDIFSRGSEPRTWSFNPPQPGVGALSEIAKAAAVRPPEQHDTYVARVGERLRHRRRAVTPWDLERMVLQEFPEVWMAKCLPNLVRAEPDPVAGKATPMAKCLPILDGVKPGPVAGKATLVAVRRPPESEILRNPEPSLFDVVTLDRIRNFISNYMPDFAEVEVVNPAYERIQVRAKVAIDAVSDDGVMAQRLKRELARYLSVWTADTALRRFGWSLNISLLHAHITALDYVRRITDFSVLHLAVNDSREYELLDTAQTEQDRRGPYGPILCPRQPWSLPLSASDHVLTILPKLQDEGPVTSGIGTLSVGELLIVSQRTPS